jgi:hypothetical protein
MCRELYVKQRVSELLDECGRWKKKRTVQWCIVVNSSGQERTDIKIISGETISEPITVPNNNKRSNMKALYIYAF